MSAHAGDAPAGPYRGLEPFDESDAAFFFGRERETRLISASLFAAPLTLLYGASGVGKSSVLRAGVLRRLRERPDLLPVIFPLISREAGTGTVVVRGWQSDPLGGIKEAVALALYESAGDDREKRRAYQDAVLRNEVWDLHTYLAAVGEVSGKRLMLILDQFEEYSLYHPDDDAFAEQFPRAIVPGDPTVSFLVSLREDALARLDRFKGRIPTLWDSYRRVDHLERSAAEDAIRLPLREYNRLQPSGSAPVSIEDELVDAVLGEVQTESVQFETTGSGTVAPAGDGGARIETPYLQMVMTRLWERERAEGSRTLRLATLYAEGGAATIVRTHLDRVMQQFSPEEQDVAARVFHRLVTPTGAKIAFSVQDLAEYETVSADRLAPILRRLEEGSHRILRRVATRAAADEPRYEIFHDRLGKAILAWRSAHLAEQAREESKRHEAEQRQLSRAASDQIRGIINRVMDRAAPEVQAGWARMMFYLVSTDGRRFALSASELARLSNQPPALVKVVLTHLSEGAIVREAFERDPYGDPQYEVVDAAMAAALLEWHSQYVLRQTRETREHANAGKSAPPQSGPEKGTPRLKGTPSRPRGTREAAGEFPYDLVRDLLRKGRVVPFLGAGVSLSARPQGPGEVAGAGPFLPSSRELKEMLARESDFPAGAFEVSDLATVASFYAQVFGRAHLDEFLFRTLGRSDYEPSATHRYLAAAAAETPLVILTTNYDDLMERALAEAGVPYDVVAYHTPVRNDGKFAALTYGSREPTYVTGNVFTARPRTLVTRLHGALLHGGTSRGSYVITEEDHLEWLFRANRSPPAIPDLVWVHLAKSNLLSLGISGRDWSQRALLHLMPKKGHPGQLGWAIALHPDPVSIMTWQRYGVQPFDVALNEWAARMRGEDEPETERRRVWR